MTPRSRLRLAPRSAPDLPPLIEVPLDGLVIGRDPSCDIVIEDDDHPYVSSRHARIAWDRGQLTVEDLGSKNGTSVDDKPVESATPIPVGSVIRLGLADGVSFEVMDREAQLALTQTVSIGSVIDALPDHSGIGRTTIVRLRDVLEKIDPEGKASATKRRRPSKITIAAFVVIGLLGTYAFLELRSEQRKQESEQTGREEAFKKIMEARALEQQEERKRFELERQALVEKQQELERRIAEVSAGSAPASVLDDLERQFSEVNNRLELYEPLRLDAEAEVEIRARQEAVLRAVVYVENRVVFFEPDTKNYVLREKQTSNIVLGPLDQAGADPVGEQQSGSGFCVDASGLIVTNAHVIETEVPETIVQGDVVFQRRQTLEVVFHGQSKRLPVEVVRVMTVEPDDFALLRITEPGTFDVVPEFTTDRPVPESGSSIRLFGFPLGRRLPQRGDRLEASLLSGSVSRQDLDPYVQVQSVVYPGTSGGPALDADGRVFGVITAVATIPGGQIASDIGYVLPIHRMRQLLEVPNSSN